MISLEIHLVREHSFADGERRCQVLAQKLFLRVGLDGSQDLLVHFNLVSFSLIRDDVGLFLLLEDLALAVTDLLGLLATEVLVIHVVWHLHVADVDLGLCGNAIDLVDASHRASVDAEWPSHEQQARRQLLQEHNALSLVYAGNHDQDSARGDGGAQFVLVLAEGLLVVGETLGAALRGQRAGRLGQLHKASIAILFTADLFRYGGRRLDCNFLLGLFILDKGGLLVVHLGPRKPHDPSVDPHVPRRVSHGTLSYLNKV